MTAFLDLKRKTPDYVAVVAAIRKCNPAIVDRAIAEGFQPIAAGINELRYGKETEPTRLKEFGRDKDISYRWPYDDHTSLRCKDGKRHFISQPYSLGLRDVIGMVEVCRSHNLDMTISALSDYFPTATLHIAYTKK